MEYVLQDLENERMRYDAESIWDLPHEARSRIALLEAAIYTPLKEQLGTIVRL